MSSVNLADVAAAAVRLSPLASGLGFAGHVNNLKIIRMNEHRSWQPGMTPSHTETILLDLLDAMFAPPRTWQEEILAAQAMPCRVGGAPPVSGEKSAPLPASSVAYNVPSFLHKLSFIQQHHIKGVPSQRKAILHHQLCVAQLPIGVVHLLPLWHR